MGEAWSIEEVNEEDHIEKRGASLEHSLEKQNEPPLEKTGKLNQMQQGINEINKRTRNSNRSPAKGKQHESRGTWWAVF